MFYFRLAVDPDVLVWVRAIYLLLEDILISSHLGKKHALSSWVY